MTFLTATYAVYSIREIQKTTKSGTIYRMLLDVIYPQKAI